MQDPLALSHVILGILVLMTAKFSLALLSPYSTDAEMTDRDNPAFGIAAAGYYAGAALIYIAAAATAGPLPADQGSSAVLIALSQDFSWALAGILALNASRWVLDRALVSHIRNDVEIASKRNVGAGALECGGYVASAILVAGALRQPGGNVWTVLAFFVLGIVALVAMGRLYQAWAGYNMGHEIQSGNLAAGVAFGLTLAALAILLARAVSGEFAGWGRTLAWFGIDAVAGLVLLLVLRWVTDLVLLPHARIAEEIARDRNVNVGLIEGVLAVSISGIILFLF
jgi:uncharacterized membrane protein YjfL (UPF0719 family)